MDDKTNKTAGFFSSFNPKSSDPDLNIPVTAGDSRVISPFLNYDPRVIQNSDQYIFPEGAGRQRGRFEMAFAMIGGFTMTGALVGGATGLYAIFVGGETKGLTGAAKVTQMLNICAKRMASTGQKSGTIALMFSVFGVALSWARGKDDNINTVSSGTLTGMLFKSSAGWRQCFIGGGVGGGLALGYCLATSSNVIRQRMGRE